MTGSIELAVKVADSVSSLQLMDATLAETITEYYRTVVTLAANAVDTPVAAPLISSAKLVVIKSDLPVSVKLNLIGNTVTTGVKLMALDATGISSLFLSNPDSTDAATVEIFLAS